MPVRSCAVSMMFWSLRGQKMDGGEIGPKCFEEPCLQNQRRDFGGQFLANSLHLVDSPLEFNDSKVFVRNRQIIGAVQMITFDGTASKRADQVYQYIFPNLCNMVPKLASATILCLVFTLALVNASNLKTNTQSFCSPSLLQKFTSTNKPATPGEYAALIRSIQTAVDPMAVVNSALSMSQTKMETFFTLHQLSFQAKQEFDRLDPSIVAQCTDPSLDFEYCTNTCFNAYSEVLKPGNALGCDADNLVPCLTSNVCKQSMRTFIEDLLPDGVGLSMEEYEQLLQFRVSPRTMCLLNMPNAMVAQQCDQSFDDYYEQMADLFAASFLQVNQQNPDPIGELQTAYLYSKAKFGHEVGRISMGCRVLINTAPLSNTDIAV